MVPFLLLGEGTPLKMIHFTSWDTRLAQEFAKRSNQFWQSFGVLSPVVQHSGLTGLWWFKSLGVFFRMWPKKPAKNKTLRMLFLIEDFLMPYPESRLVFSKDPMVQDFWTSASVFFRIWSSQTVSNRRAWTADYVHFVRRDIANFFGSVANVPFILASLHIQVSEFELCTCHDFVSPCLCAVLTTPFCLSCSLWKKYLKTEDSWWLKWGI